MESISRQVWRHAALPKACFVGLALFACLATTKVASGRQFSTVVIDAGHGGFDLGGIPHQRVAEKGMNLDVAQRLGKKLRSAGYRVVMTRDSDVFISLGERVRIANSYRDAVFVCVHFNSATRAGANGIETYYFSDQSAALAANIHRQVVGGTDTDNRGIRRRGYYVLRRTSIPAILVECGFLTNPTEAGLALQSTVSRKTGRPHRRWRYGEKAAAKSAGCRRADACCSAGPAARRLQRFREGRAGTFCQPLESFIKARKQPQEEKIFL